MDIKAVVGEESFVSNLKGSSKAIVLLEPRSVGFPDKVTVCVRKLKSESSQGEGAMFLKTLVEEGLISRIKFNLDSEEFVGDFIVSDLKISKKGYVSFVAHLTGPLTHSIGLK